MNDGMISVEEARERILESVQRLPAEVRPLREVLGPHVQQRGSLVDADKTRFDFSHNAPLTDEQIRRIEALVNADMFRAFARALPVVDGQGQVTRWYGTLTDIDEGHRRSENRDLLARELSHRIKNIFAVVAGLVGQRRQVELVRRAEDRRREQLGLHGAEVRDEHDHQANGASLRFRTELGQQPGAQLPRRFPLGIARRAKHVERASILARRRGSRRGTPRRREPAELFTAVPEDRMQPQPSPKVGRPIERILVETDAPYLTPEPVRKIKTNEPSFVVHTARVVAEMKGMSYEEFDRASSENARRFYRW